MPTVTGRVVKPSGGSAGAGRVRVRFRLVDSNGRHVTQAWDTNAGRVIVDYEDVDLDAEGDYTIDLPANVDIEPAGTRWSRVVMLRGNEGPARSLIVPAGGGPYDELDILDEAVDPLPTPEPSNELDAAEVTSPVTGLTGDFGLKAIANTVVTVPQLARPVYLFGVAPLQLSADDEVCGAAIAPTGSTSLAEAVATHQAQRGGDPPVGGLLGDPVLTCSPWARLPANSPGDYQLFAYASAGTVDVEASQSGPARLVVLGV